MSCFILSIILFGLKMPMLGAKVMLYADDLIDLVFFPLPSNPSVLEATMQVVRHFKKFFG